MLKISTKQKTLRQSYVSALELKVGTLITASVFKKVEKGIVVAIAPHLYGFVFNFMLGDEFSKNSKKIATGTKILCRVMNVESWKMDYRAVLCSNNKMTSGLQMSQEEQKKLWTEGLKQESLAPGVIMSKKDKGFTIILPWGIRVIFHLIYEVL